MKHIFQILTLGSFMFLISCSSTRVMTDYMEYIDFNQYETFLIEKHTQDYQNGVNPLNEQRIERNLQRYFDNMGYVESSDPDLLVKYFVKTDSKRFIQWCNTFYGRWRRGTICYDRVVEYEKGTLIVDIIDLEDGTVIWHGALMGPVIDNLKYPDREIKNLVGELMSEFQTLRMDKKSIAKGY